MIRRRLRLAPLLVVVLAGVGGGCAVSKTATYAQLAKGDSLMSAPAEGEFNIPSWAGAHEVERTDGTFGRAYSIEPEGPSEFSAVDFLTPFFWCEAWVGRLPKPISMEQAKSQFGLQPVGAYGYFLAPDDKEVAALPWRRAAWLRTSEKGVALVVSPAGEVIGIARNFERGGLFSRKFGVRAASAEEDVEQAIVLGRIAPSTRAVVDFMRHDPSEETRATLNGLAVRMQPSWLDFIDHLGSTTVGTSEAEKLAVFSELMTDVAHEACSALPRECARFLRVTVDDIAGATQNVPAAAELHSALLKLRPRLEGDVFDVRTAWTEVHAVLADGTLTWAVLGELRAALAGHLPLYDELRLYRRLVNMPKNGDANRLREIQKGGRALRKRLLAELPKAAQKALDAGLFNLALARGLTARSLAGSQGQALPPGLTRALNEAAGRLAPSLSFPKNGAIKPQALFEGLGFSTMLTHYARLDAEVLKQHKGQQVPDISLELSRPFNVTLGRPKITSKKERINYTVGRTLQNSAYATYVQNKKRLAAKERDLERRVAASSKNDTKRVAHSYKSSRLLTIGHDVYRITQKKRWVTTERDFVNSQKTSAMRDELEGTRRSRRRLRAPSKTVFVRDKKVYEYAVKTKRWPGKATRSFTLVGGGRKERLDQSLDVSTLSFVRHRGNRRPKVVAKNEWPRSDGHLKAQIRRQLDKEAGTRVRQLYRKFQQDRFDRFESALKAAGHSNEDRKAELAWAKALWMGQSSPFVESINPSKHAAFQGDAWAEGGSASGIVKAKVAKLRSFTAQQRTKLRLDGHDRWVPIPNSDNWVVTSVVPRKLKKKGIRIYDAETQRVRKTKMRGQVSCFTEGGSYLVTESSAYDVLTEKKITGARGHCVPGGRLLFDGLNYRLFDLETGKQSNVDFGNAFAKRRRKLSNVAFSPDGTLIFATTKIWRNKIEAVVVDTVKKKEIYRYELKESIKPRISWGRYDAATGVFDFNHKGKKYKANLTTGETERL